MHNFSKLLQKELICALGCTEPIAVALAASKAREVLGEVPVRVEVHCSGNIIKNVKGVTVPNSNGLKGVDSATALGVVAGDSSLGLEVLSKVMNSDIEKAKELIRNNKIEVILKEGIENLDIEIVAFDDKGNNVEVEIKNKHTNIVKISKNGENIELMEEAVSNTDEYLYDGMDVKSILDYVNTVDINEIKDYIKRQMELNTAISEEGLNGKWGSSIGSLLLSEDDNLRTRARAKAAAGSDARMSGCSLPVVINAGSGNQGITCCIPVMEYAKENNTDEETLIRALMLSNLVALHIKRYIGRLSAFCGVTSAGAASGAGIAYIETRDYKIIAKTIENALMIVSGMICDGAKPSCAAKIASAVDAGITGFTMAKNGRNFDPGDGLMKNDVEETIKAIGALGKEGMKQTDIEVLHLMIQK